MKRCTACGEEVDNQFIFCPVDGLPLESSTQSSSFQYRPTLISEQSLATRLIVEIRFVIERLRLAWPTFKAQPITFSKRELRRVISEFKRITQRPYFAAASLSAITILVTVVTLVLIFSSPRDRHSAALDDGQELGPVTTMDFRNDEKDKSQPGIGAGQKGRVGFNQGRGEGSNLAPARAQGGGGGGDHNPLQASRGRLPVRSEIPAPIPTTWAHLPQSLPAAGMNIDPVLLKDLPFRDYGDPRSKSTAPSNGPGNSGGVGTGDGTGVGEGTRSGFGPGRNGNTGDGDNHPGSGGPGGNRGGNNPDVDIDRVFRTNELTSRVRVLSKPEPQYSEEARRDHITGTVILSVIFSRTGQVTNIRAVQSLCCGLTERAIAAAGQIRFAPATKDGKPVSTRMQLEYNFNLY